MPSAPCVASVLRTVVGFVPSLSFVRRHCSGTTTFVNQRRRYKGTTTTATSWKMSVAPATTVGISGLEFESTFTTELPADPERRNEPRPVQNAAFSFVESTPPSADDNTSAWREASSAGQVDSSESRRLVLRKALVAWSPSCAGLFDLPDDRYPNSEEEETIIDVLGGFGPLCPGMVPYAMCYGGHQFGNWAGQLGDGRAISLGEYVNARSERWEIQVKGAGKTPYSRFADGRAVLRSSVREFLCSEAMHFLGVPTTRALSLITTGAGVVRDMFYDGNPQLEPGAVVARVAPSFLRLGNFQIAAARGDFDLLRKTADYAIKWHFPQFKTLPTDVDSDGDNRYTALLRKVAELNAEMVAMWQGIGFVHGVMNTDNFSILGLTIDYGPYGFLDNFDPNYTPNTTDIPGRRYKFSGQPMVAHWNIMQFAKCMMPLCGPDAIEIVEDFGNIYKKAQAGVMSKKMGLMEWKGEEDEALVDGFLACMHYSNADFTNTWRALSRIETSSTEEERDAWYQSLCLDSDERGLKEWMDWLNKYQQRLKENEKMTNEERVTSMNKMNPVYILRNYMAQTAIEMAEKGDYSEVRQLYELLKNPYEEQDNMEKYTEPPPKWATRRGMEHDGSEQQGRGEQTEDDDFFGSQADDESSEQERRDREIEALRRPHYTAGVREGVSAAHEANVQGGFDAGFADGAKAVAEAGFLYGASSVVLAFFAKNGCYSRSEERVQKMDDTEVPTSSLRNLQNSVTKLRADIRQLPQDSIVSTEHAQHALSEVSFVQIPPIAKVNPTKQPNSELEQT